MPSLWVQHTREAARVIITLLVLPAFLAVIGKLIWPQRRMLIEARAAVFLIATLALGPGLLTNVILKDHWGRPRPIDVQQFGGDYRFTSWWDPRGDCPDNCSFIAGEPSGAFWTLAPAALAGPELQPLAYAAALAFGAAVGVLRIAAGAHFFSDVVFAGVFTVSVDLAHPRPDLSLAGDPHRRGRRRAPANRSRRQARGAGAAADRTQGQKSLKFPIRLRRIQRCCSAQESQFRRP